jgi:hypothetical protein
MSDANVRLVQSLLPAAGSDLTRFFRDEAEWARIARIYEPRAHDNLESGFVRAGERITNQGLEGFRQTWLDWLEPWESYRADILKIVPHDEHVVVLVHDYGRRPGMTAEVRLRGAAVWTVRDGKLARAFFYTDRADALDDVGLDAAILAGE